MQNIKKNTILTYNSNKSMLNGVKYKVLSAGVKQVKLEAVYGQAQLTGFPTLRQPFNISITDLQEAIKENIYTINN
jgi:hypothetical protein